AKEKEALAKEKEALDRQRVVNAYHEWLADNAQAARDLLREAGDRQGTWEGRYVNRLCNLGQFHFDEHQRSVTGVAFSPSGTHLASCARDGAVYLRDLHDGRSERLAVTPDTSTSLTDLAWSPRDGRHLVVADEKGFLQIWDFHERRTIARWQAHE